MPYSHDYLQYVLDQLAGLQGAVSRSMFGGAGLYCDDLFFGLIAADDTLYFRVNDDNRPDYEALGMARFRPYKDKPLMSFNYYEVPPRVLENADELVTWARRSLKVAEAAEKKVRPKRKVKAKGRRRKPTAQGKPRKPTDQENPRKPIAQGKRRKPTARKK
jgi:DNA transformation protein